MRHAGAPAPQLNGRGIEPSAAGRGAVPRHLAAIAAGTALAVVLLLALPPAPGRAVELDLGFAAENLVPPEDLIGEWSAVVEVKKHPQPVTLQIVEVTPGKTAGKMTFASPRRCFIDLEYGGPHEGRHIFYMIRFTNCFEYENSDFVAVSRIPSEIAARKAAKETAPMRDAKAKRQQDILDQYELGQGGPNGAQPAIEPRKKLEHILYAIGLDGEEHEAGVLARR